MNKRLARLSVFAALLVAAVASVYAGGWTIITLNDFPDHAVAGKPLTLTFSIRQHGNNLLAGLKPAVRASTAGGLEIDAAAHPTANQGEYSATVRLVSPGEWTIRVDSGFNPEDKVRAYNSLVLPSLKVIRDDAPLPAYSSTERGSRLFVAKGCIGCHATGSEKDLSQKQFAADYLKKFLADPSIRKVDMPNLQLKQEEISALTAFINASSKRKGI